jgi:hypothetical protein
MQENEQTIYGAQNPQFVPSFSYFTAFFMISTGYTEDRQFCIYTKLFDCTGLGYYACSPVPYINTRASTIPEICETVFESIIKQLRCSTPERPVHLLDTQCVYISIQSFGAL